MPPHCEQAGPRSRPWSFAGTTGGRVGQRGAAGLASRSAVAAVRGRSCPPFACPLPPPLSAPDARLLGYLLGAHLLRKDAELLLHVRVEEARRQPAHDVVGQRLRERDLRVRRHALRVEAHVAELAHERLERHAVLEADRDRGRERVHHPAQGRAVLADVGQEDLAQRAVLVAAGGDVALVAGDRELVRERLALARQPVARRAAAPPPAPFASSCASVRSACAVFEPSR